MRLYLFCADAMIRLRHFFFVIILCFIWNACADDSSAKIASPPVYTNDFVYHQLTDEQVAHYKSVLEPAYEKLLVRSGFNGSILVAKNGTVLLEDYRGVVDPKTKLPVTPETAFHIASTTKTFTAMALLRMVEQGRLDLDDSIQKFISGFPYKGITIKLLMSHRSGLPNYLHFMEKVGKNDIRFTNDDVIRYMMVNKPAVAAYPDRQFKYCNTNYLILASVLEKITGTSYPEYMRDSVFMPLGLHHSYIFSIKDTATYQPTFAANWRSFPMDKFDCTYGDKNMYSTVRDLWEWDKVLYTDKFISKAMLDSAFLPLSHETKSKHNYGLGWRSFTDEDETIIYHNGRWHGSNAVFARLINDTTTVIVIGNKYNGRIYKSKSLGLILNGKNDTNDLSE